MGRETMIGNRARWRSFLVTGAVVLLPVLLIGLFLLVRDGFAEVREQRAIVDRTLERRADIQHLLMLHQDIETGQRGYVITANPAFLDPYRRAAAELPALKGKLERAFAGDPASLQVYRELERRSAERLAVGQTTMTLVAGGESKRARQLIASGIGKQLMDGVRADVARLNAIQTDQLAAANAARDESRGELEATIYGVLGGFSFLLAVVAAYIGRSIRARQAAHARVQELSHRQQAMFDAAQDGMLMLDADGYIRELNPSTSRLFGYEAADLRGRHNTFLMAHPPSLRDSQAWLRQVGTAGNEALGAQREFHGRRSDGSTFVTDVSISRFANEGETYFIAIVRDVTARRRVEAMKTEFVSTVSHELRTPLTSIGGSLGLLAAGAVGPLGDKAERLVRIAHSNCERLIRLINDILDIEKIESGRMEFDLRRMALTPLIERTVAANRGFADQHQITLQTVLPPWPITVLGDPDRLEQLLTNLVSNAIKHSPAGETVEIALDLAGPLARIEVRDRGAGVPAAFRDRIFGRFAMADSSDSRAKGGTGLGLAIAREIADRHGGKVGFADWHGGGTVFHFALPHSCADAEPADAVDRSLPVILHVEDDADCQSLVAAAFDGRARIVPADSLAAARRVLGSQSVAGAIVDVMLPPENGLDLVDGLRAASPDLPIVVFTALDGVEDRRGASAVLTKSRSSLPTLVETAMALVAAAQTREPA